MPRKSTRRKSRRSTRRRGTRTGAPLTRTRWTRKKRVEQNLTRDVRWFKRQTGIASNTNGNFRSVYDPGQIDLVDDFQNWARNWEEFKVLAMYVKFIPAFVGSENTTNYRRGNAITFFDQGEEDQPITFTSIMVKPSAQLMNPRRRHTRWCNRPRGNPRWGTLNNTGIISEDDQWQDTRLQIFGTNFSPSGLPGAQVWFFVEIGYKVVFRGRQSTSAQLVNLSEEVSNRALPAGFNMGFTDDVDPSENPK